MTPRAPPVRSDRNSVGSSSFRNGAPAVKAASVFSNAGMGCGDLCTKDLAASGAGSGSEYSPIMSSISVPTWPSELARGEILSAKQPCVDSLLQKTSPRKHPPEQYFSRYARPGLDHGFEF